MKNLRGNHTSLIPLAEEVSKILTKNLPKISIAPGFITRKNVKIKENAIHIKYEITSILLNILMKGSKQTIRLFSDLKITETEVKKVLEEFCKQKQINLKIKN